MYTLVYYLNGHLNRPDNLGSFLSSNVGKSPLLTVDCVTPYQGTEKDLIDEVCKHLNRVDPHVKVVYNVTQNISTEVTQSKPLVHFLVMQIDVSER